MNNVTIAFNACCTFVDGHTYNTDRVRHFYAKDYANYAELGNAIKRSAEHLEHDFWYEVSRREDRHIEANVSEIWLEYWNAEAKEWVEIIRY